MGTPIINLPQTAILGMHAIKERPIAVNGKVGICNTVKKIKNSECR
jgi:2-oxoglutarate dehydrogenase E2 component (dihydrolipoamide succinyltransferase)